MKILWSIIAFVVAILIVLGSKNMLAFRPTLFIILLLLLSLLISLSLWAGRKRLR